MTLAGRFSLDDVFGSEKQKAETAKTTEKPVSEDVSVLLSNFSKTIGIVSYEKKIALKQKSMEALSVSKTV